MALPAVAWLVWRSPGVLRLSHYAIAGGVVGGSPWIVWNLTHGLKGVLPVTSVAGEESTYFSRFGDLFTIVLPEWLGVRLPYSKDWLVWAPLGVVLTAAAVTLLLVAFARRPRGAEPLLVIAAVYPFLYAATSFTFFTDEPRYLTFIAPVRRSCWRRSSVVRASRSGRSPSRSAGRPSTSCGSRIRVGSATSVSPRTWGR